MVFALLRYRICGKKCTVAYCGKRVFRAMFPRFCGTGAMPKAYHDVLRETGIPYCIFALLRYGICSGSGRFCVAKAGMWWSQTGPQWGKKWTVTGPKVGHKRTRTASELYVSPRRLGSVVVQKWLWSGPEVGPKVVPAWAEPHRKSCRFFGEILLAGWSISGLAFWAIGPYNEGIYYK